MAGLRTLWLVCVSAALLCDIITVVRETISWYGRELRFLVGDTDQRERRKRFCKLVGEPSGRRTGGRGSTACRLPRRNPKTVSAAAESLNASRALKRVAGLEARNQSHVIIAECDKLRSHRTPPSDKHSTRQFRLHPPVDPSLFLPQP